MRVRRRKASRTPPPTWTGPRTGTRVLVEHPDGAIRTILAERLRRRGYEVCLCGGPGDGVGCPLLQQQPCPAVDGADVVVTGLVGDVRGRVITSRIRRRRPDLPVIAEATDRMAQGSEVLAEVHRVYPLGGRDLFDLVDSL